jgi:uncharacterized membrane protein
MSPRTIFLGRLIGLSYILFSLSMFTHKQATIGAVTSLLQNAPLMFILGLIGLVAGLAMVLAHNVWSGGALPVIVTLVGWATLIKCLLLLFLSPEAESRVFLEGLHYEQLFYFYYAFAVLLGIYMVYAASRAQARQAT